MIDVTSNPNRRTLIGAATIGASISAASACAHAQGVEPLAAFATPKQIEAGVLNVGYVELGAADAPPALLLHGWPYDIHAFADVAPLLAARGYRAIVPYLRGYGSTRFLSNDAVRNGQQSAIALDMIALMDALHIERAVVAGFDWGARTADIMAALWPQRCKALVSVSGYLIGNQAAGRVPLRLPPNSNGGISITSPPSAAASAISKTHATSPN